MNKYSKVNNPDRVSKDAKGLILFEELKNEPLDNVIEYWVTVNKNSTIVEEFNTDKDKTTLIKEINKKVKELEILIKKL